MTNLKTVKKNLDKHSNKIQYAHLTFFIIEIAICLYSILMEIYISLLMGIIVMYMILRHVKQYYKIKNRLDKAIEFQSFQTTDEHLKNCGR